MKTKISTFLRKSPPRRVSALTLLEMLVAMSLLVVIVMGLTMMFLQTQRAFKSGLRQVDIFESGRAVMELITRDLEQMSYADQGTNVYSFAVQSAGYNDLYQYENGNSRAFRTNQLFDLFSLSQIGSRWVATGYAVTNNAPGKFPGVGTLYRYTYALPVSDSLANNLLWDRFNHDITNFPANNAPRIADGVVHFKIRAFDSRGLEVFDVSEYPYIQTVVTTNTLIRLPSYLEVELGVLEPETLDQARALPFSAATNFLQTRAGKVHVFRQQIPIRAATR